MHSRYVDEHVDVHKKYGFETVPNTLELKYLEDVRMAGAFLMLLSRMGTFLGEILARLARLRLHRKTYEV